MTIDPKDLVKDIPTFDLTGKAVLVTGGNSGIGLTAAAAMAQAGASVAIWGRRADRNSAAAIALREVSSSEVVSSVVDVTVPEAVKSGFGTVIDHFGRLDCVFVNAGIGEHSPSFLEIGHDLRDRIFRTNLFGAWSTIEVSLAHMAQRAEAGDPGGSIVVNGSLAATRGFSGGEAYGAAKAALGAIVRGVAAGYGEIGVRANMICPGYIEREGSPGRYASVLSKRGPIPRYGRPAEIAGIVVYLASDAASYHNGDTITIDGGWSVDVG